MDQSLGYTPLAFKVWLDQYDRASSKNYSRLPSLDSKTSGARQEEADYNRRFGIVTSATILVSSLR